MVPILRPLPDPPLGVEVRRTCRKYPQHTVVLGGSTIDDAELDRMVDEEKIAFRSVARAPWGEEVPEPLGHEVVVFKAFFNAVYAS